MDYPLSNINLLIIDSCSSDDTVSLARDYLSSSFPSGDWEVISLEKAGKSIAVNYALEIIETELFDELSLKYYAKKNCGMEVTDEEKKLFETEYRGGSQGDYSIEMNEKITNVVNSLVEFPSSKRAVIMMNNTWWFHDDTDEAKCCGELHFRLTP